jgi:uncharacterized protein
VYVHLKHTLSTLTLAAVGNRRMRATVDWLAANADRIVSPNGASHDSAPPWLIAHKILERRDQAVVLADAYRPHADYLRRQVRRSARTLKVLARTRRGRTKIDAVRRGTELFNGGLFFECHEYFEGLWRRARAHDRAFYQWIILVAAGFYHIEKGNRHGARTKITAGVERLRQYPSEYLGVRLRRWLAALEPWQARASEGEALTVVDLDEVPRIPLSLRSVQ